MIYAPLSSTVRSTEMRLAAAARAAALPDGVALVFGLENGQRVVAPSAGVAGEKFAGFSRAQTSAAPALPADAVKVENHTSSAGGTLTLDKTPLAGQVYVAVAATGATVTIANVTGKVVTLTGANSTDVVVTYARALSAAEAVAAVGNVQPGGYAGLMLGQTGVAQQGVEYTDQINASVNWAAATAIKLNAAGKLTDQSGSGVAINAVVVQVPTVDYPFLGIQYNTI